MYDETETERIRRQQELNSRARDRAALEEAYGKVWDTDQVREEFEVKSFLAPFCIVVRKSDGALGTLEFQHEPRFYFSFLKH